MDRKILVRKLRELRLPMSTLNLTVGFLRIREQRVKLGCDCYAEWWKVPAGVGQKPKLRPWLFSLNDLRATGVDQIKFVGGPIRFVKFYQMRTKLTHFNQQYIHVTNLFRLHETRLPPFDCKQVKNEFRSIIMNEKPNYSAELLLLIWNEHICKQYDL